MDQKQFLNLLDDVATQLREWTYNAPLDVALFVLKWPHELTFIQGKYNRFVTYLQISHPVLATDIQNRWDELLRYAWGVEGPNRVSHEMYQEDIVIEARKIAVRLFMKLEDVSSIIKQEASKGTAVPTDNLAREDKQRKDKLKLKAEIQAIAVLIKNPGWSKRNIAKHIGCTDKTLSPKQAPKFDAAFKLLKQDKGNLPKGSKDKDGNIEAYDA